MMVAAKSPGAFSGATVSMAQIDHVQAHLRIPLPLAPKLLPKVPLLPSRVVSGATIMICRRLKSALDPLPGIARSTFWAPSDTIPSGQAWI